VTGLAGPAFDQPVHSSGMFFGNKNRHNKITCCRLCYDVISFISDNVDACDADDDDSHDEHLMVFVR